MLRFILLLTVVVFGRTIVLAQPCDITTLATPETITCGDCTTLSAFGYGAGNIAFQEDFNSGSPVGWQFTQAVTIANNTCGVPSPDGSPFMWMGDASVNPRSMETVPFDLTLGGVICFEMRYAIQGQASPCEGPDLANEGVYVQYSTNGGGTWTTIQYWDPNGGNDPQYTNWNQYCVNIPPGAQTASTMIRWYQDDVSGAEYDHWGIDNVLITLNDPNFEISWLHDGYNYGLGQGGGVNPTPVCPTTTTSYEAIITDGTETCSSIITIIVEDPVLVVNAGEDTTICPGECIDLNGVAEVIVSPAKEPTYCDNTVEFIAGTSAVPFLGIQGTIDVELDINIGDLNMTNILNGSITEVCINGFTLFNGASLADLTVELSCPDGTTIVLVPQGTTNGQTYLNTCFVPASPPITGGTSPYSGTFNPNQPFDNLVGCSANGTWTLSISGTHNELFPPTGTLSGWCISFDDPEISYEADFTWSPLTDMTNETTLTPTVCPTSEITYTLEATDANGCISVSDEIMVSIDVCCALQIDDIVIVPASCQANDGTITIETSGAITGLVFSIDGGVTFQPSNQFTGLGAGDYTIVVTDDNACDVTENITILNNQPPSIDNLIVTESGCNASDGTIGVVVSGGTEPYTYSIDGISFQPGNSFTDLSAGPYTVTVEDASGCQTTEDAIIQNTDAPVIDNISVTDATCGSANGSINITASGGALPLNFSIDGGTTTQLNGLFENLNGGNYTITVTDNNGCSVTSGLINITGGLGVITADMDTEPNSSCLQCNYDGPSIMINELMVSPTSGDGSLSGVGAGDGRGEWIELYNPNWCDSVDISCYYLGNSAPGASALSGTQSGGYVIPGGTIIPPLGFALIRGVNAAPVPPGLLVANGGNVVELIVPSEITDPGVCVGPDATRLWFPNAGGWFAFYDAQGVPQDAVRWGTGNVGDLAGTPCVPQLNPCDFDGTLLSYNDIPAENKTHASTADASSHLGQSIRRFPDGGAWNATGVPTYATCNDPNNCLAETGISFCNGTATVNVTTGDAPFTYQWNDPANQTSQTALNLCEGEYEVVVTDANGCTETFIVTVIEDLFTIEAVGINPTCYGTNGSISVTTDPAGDYTYDWSSNTGVSDDQTTTVNNLEVDTYTVAVTAGGCTRDTTITLTSNGIEDVEFTAVHTSCDLINGFIEIDEVIGGTAPYTYDFNGQGSGTTDTFENLEAGTYTITVEDADGCDYFVTDILINPSEGIDNSLITFTEATCGFSDGEIMVEQVFGGQEPYLYTLNGNASDEGSFINLASGQYTLIIEDAIGCVLTQQYTIPTAASIEEVYVPNVVTPNNDMVNDLWFVKADCVEKFECTILNRWGNLIYDYDNINGSWDGRDKSGQLVSEGVYFYKVKLTFYSGNSEDLHGFITVILK